MVVVVSGDGTVVVMTSTTRHFRVTMRYCVGCGDDDDYSDHDKEGEYGSTLSMAWW